MNNTILAIAFSTLRGFSRDRIFHATIIFALLFIGFTFFLAGLTIVETKKILLDFGFSALSFAGIVMALFVGLTSIGKELENKTIYTILSKPISRTSYLLGKYLGCSLVIIITHIIMSITLIAIVSMVDKDLPKGLLVCFYFMTLESLIILAIATFFSVSVSSTFLAACLTVGVFLIGRSSSSIQNIVAKSDSPSTKTLLKIFYDIFPSLNRFNIREVIAYGKPYPEEMLLWSNLYFIAYAILFLSLSSLVFQRKDLP